MSTDRFRQACVPAAGRLRDALEALQRGGVEIALVVDASMRLVGLMTDGDVRRALLAGAPLDAPLERWVQQKYIFVSPETSRAEVMEMMRARWLGQIPIVDAKGTLIGLHLLHEVMGAAVRPNTAVVMAGGKGIRLRPITEHLPKPMIPVAGKPILERIVLHLVGAGIRRVYLAVNYLAQVIESHFGNGERFGCHIEYLRESKPLGTGGALSLLPHPPAEPVLVMNGDLLTQANVGGMLDAHTERSHAVTVGTYDYVHTVPFGVLELAGQRVVELREKPTMSWTANAGIYVISPHVLARLERGSEFPVTRLIEDCLRRGEVVGAYPIEGEWIDVGRQRELARARGETERE